MATDMISRDPSRSPSDRAVDLLARLTPVQKVAQLGGWIMPYGKPPGEWRGDDFQVSDEFRQRVAEGIGGLSYVNLGLGVRDGTRLAARLQQYLVENTPHGIPGFFFEEAAWGHAAPEATAFPMEGNLAATFDEAFVERCFRATGLETRIRGGNFVHSPVADMARDGRWGRSSESFSEDTLVASRMMAAAVRGLQDLGPDGTVRGVGVSIKHFVAFAQSIGGRQVAQVDVGRLALLDEYLPPFRAAVEAGATGLMAAYPEIDGVPCHENTWLLRTVLRERWGFRGVVVADYGGIENLHTVHRTAPDISTAARSALLAGIDMDLPWGTCYERLLKLWDDAHIREAIDAAVVRVLELKFRLGLFEQPYPTEARAVEVVASPSHRALAQEAAERSIILLKNDGDLLPLDRSRLRKVALLGPHANLHHLGDDRAHRSTIEQGLREALGANVSLTVAPGCLLTTREEFDATYLAETADKPLTALQAAMDAAKGAVDFSTEWPQEMPPGSEEATIEAAVAATKGADVAILCLGDSKQITGENYSPTRRCDRDEIDLPGNQVELLKRVAATGVPTVVLLAYGRTLALGDVEPHARALLALGDSGQARGVATARVLLGDVEPTGRAPFTFPLTTGSIPCHYSTRPKGFPREYAFRTRLIAFPFGHGLSYTTFELGQPALAVDRVRVGTDVIVQVPVRNTGKRRGTAVVQAYLHDEFAAVARPDKALCDWARLPLEPGEEATATLTVRASAMTYHGPDERERLDPGFFKVGLGFDSANLTWVRFEVV